MQALSDFLWRDGTREDSIIGWMVIVLAIACVSVGSWLWLDWYGRRVARWRRETRELYLKMLEAEQTAAQSAEDEAREAAWKARAEETREWITVSNR